MIQNHKSTTGEEIIEFYLEDQEIKYEREFPIYGLKNDLKSFRRADFYLPKFKVYLEFLGEWNKPEGRKRYQEKMYIFAENKIPCIYIFPDNLGPLDLVFRIRMNQIFNDHSQLKVQRILFSFWKFKKILLFAPGFWAVLTLGFIFFENIFNKTLSISPLAIIVPIFLTAICIIYAAVKIFFKIK